MSKNKYRLLFIILFLIFKSTNTKKKIMILEGNAFDEALKNSIEAKSKLFLIFFVNQCPYCEHAINILNDRIIGNYEDEDEINFGIVNLDKSSNVWLGVRFNITRIPFIVLIENKKMYQFQNQFEESIVLKFIEDEKVVEDSMDIPDNFGMMNKINAIIKDITERLKLSMQIIFDKFGIKVKWNITMTYILLFIFFIIIIYLENKLINFIRRICKLDKIGSPSNSEKNKDKKNDKESDKKDEKGNSKESKNKKEIKEEKNEKKEKFKKVKKE